MRHVSNRDFILQISDFLKILSVSACDYTVCIAKVEKLAATAAARQPLYANSSMQYYAADWEASDIWFALCKVDSNRVIEVMQFCIVWMDW